VSVQNQHLINDIRGHLGNVPRGAVIDPLQEVAELAYCYSCEESGVRELFRSEARLRGVILVDD
jgi:hypothetical protein